MNETPNTRIAELFDAMAGAYETWAEPLSARLSQVAVGRTTVSSGDCVLDIGAGTGALSLQAAALGCECYCNRSFLRHGCPVEPTFGSLSKMQGARDGRPSSHV